MNSRQMPLFAFLALVLGLWAAMEYDPKPKLPTASVMPALQLKKLGDDKVTQWQVNPNTVTVVNFFASWCVPCLAEHPQLKAISKLEGIDVVGIAWNDGAAPLQRWLDKNGNPFDSVWRDVNGTAAITAGLRGVPETFVVDREGKVQLHIRGAMDKATAERLTAKLKEWRDATTQ